MHIKKPALLAGGAGLVLVAMASLFWLNTEPSSPTAGSTSPVATTTNNSTFWHWVHTPSRGDDTEATEPEHPSSTSTPSIRQPAASGQEAPTTSTSSSSSGQATPTTNPGTGQAVFRNSLLGKWFVDESSATSKIQPPTSSGTAEIQLSYTKPWQYFFIKNPAGIDVSESEVLSLMVRGTTEQEDLYVVLYDVQGKKIGASPIKDYALEKKVPSAYAAEFLVPLSKLSAERKVVGGIALESATAATVTVSKIEFRNTPDNRPIADLLSVKVPQIYIDGFQNGWHASLENVTTKTAPASGTYTKPLEISFTEDYSSIYFENDLGYKPDKYHTLHFVIRGDVREAGLTLTLFDINRKFLGEVRVRDFMNNSFSDTEFRAVNIPLDQFYPGPDQGPTYARTIRTVSITSNNAYRLSIAGITFAP